MTLPLQPGSVRLMLVRDAAGYIVGADVFFDSDQAAAARDGLAAGLDGEFRDYHPPGEWKPNRHQRRVLLVLLTGAPGLYGFTIMRLAQAGSGTVHLTLARLEGLGWAASEPDAVEAPTGGYRRSYTLTEEGRVNVARLLGMQAGGLNGGP